MYRNDNEIANIIVTLIAIVLVIAITAFAIIYERDAEVVVSDRWWNTSISVNYDTQRTGVKSVPYTSCSGFGENRTCITRTKLESYTYTTTTTRCRDRDSGRELPARIPDIPCPMRWGDYTITGTSYSIKYRMNDNQEIYSALIKRQHWDGLSPGQRRNVTLNILGNIRDIEWR
ncbi:MAG: hypothetical protein ACW99G_11390 [Candidatus Thorarchaeota archaeon]|jgi:hypothetical protein